MLERARVIPIVGLSPRPERPSHRVAAGLQRFGYRIIQVRKEYRRLIGLSPSLLSVD
jgi:predicted CoA-binding protein